MNRRKDWGERAARDLLLSLRRDARRASLMDRRTLLLMVPGLIALGPCAARAAGKTHRLAIQVSDNDADKMNAALNVAANVSRHYSNAGDLTEIIIVAFNA